MPEQLGADIESLWNHLDYFGIPVFAKRPPVCWSCGQTTEGFVFAGGGGEVILDGRYAWEVRHGCGGEWLEIKPKRDTDA